MSEKRQDSPPEGGSSPPKNLGLKTQDSAFTARSRECQKCDCAGRVLNGRPDEWVCANHPDHAGQLTVVALGGGEGDVAAGCRSFRVRREPTATVALGANDAVRYISLTGGLFAIVDAADYQWLSKYRWQAFGRNNGYYACCRSGDKTILMHRLIMNPPAGMVVDHINGNRHDNRRRNLRVCTPTENARNSRKRRGISRFKGVSWYRRFRKWAARIQHGGKAIHLGWFDDEAEAARAYDRAARRLFGQFACLNFPEPANIVWLTGRICVHSHVFGRLVTTVRHNMPARSVDMAPSLYHWEPRRGIWSRMRATSLSELDVSTPLRSAQHDKDIGHGDVGWNWRLERGRVFALSRGPPGHLGNHALKALD